MLGEFDPAEYSLSNLLSYYAQNGLTYQLADLTLTVSNLLAPYQATDSQHLPEARRRIQKMVGHICLLMRFNELEFQTWTLLTLLILNFQPHALFGSLLQLLLVSAIYTKAFMESDVKEPDADALPEEVS
jgi:hypothetical protein